MKNKYLSITDFAERVKVSPQAIYKRQYTDLKPFIKLVEGKKAISEAALQLFSPTNLTPAVEQPVDNQITPEDRLISSLEKELENVNSQFRLTTEMLQDEQSKNTDLQKQILNLQEHILKLSNDFSELAKQSNILFSQSQQLQALQAPKPEPVPEPEPDPPPEKKGWFSRFRKK